MPYADRKSMPPSTKHLSIKAGKVWRAVFNKCHAEGKPEEQCFKMAFGAANKANGGT